MTENNNKIVAIKAMGEMCPSRIRIRRALLILSGDTARSLAEKLGVNETYVSLIIHGVRKNRPLQEAIAAAWQVLVEEIF